MKLSAIIPTVMQRISALPLRNQVILDVGCGFKSPLSSLRGWSTRLIGLDVEPVIEEARKRETHDEYVVGDVRELHPSMFAGRGINVVAAVDVIEHLDRDEGFAFLQSLESITSDYVLIQTPCGYNPQGPEYGSQFQRHRSGWFPHDFQSLGYTVYGTTGHRWTHGYMGDFRPDWRVTKYVDAALATGFMVHRNPRWAANIIAVKNVNGVPARKHLTPEADLIVDRT